MKAFVHFLISIIFSLFAIVQWNDPDFYIWMPVYFLVAFIAFRAGRSQYHVRLCLFLLIVFLLWLMSYAPQFSSWVSDGMPSIANSMKAESPYIEFVRESLGLLLCTISVGYYYWLSKKKS